MKNMNCKALTMSLLVAIIMLLPFAASAQRSDRFFSGFEDDDYENRIAFIGLGNQPFGTEPAPVGSGLLVLTVAGAGYAALRRKRSDKSGKSHKTYTTCVLTLAMVLAFTGCKKKIEPVVNSGETVHVTLNVGNGNRHIIEPNENGYVPVSYSAGDVIYVGNGSTYIGTLSYVEEQGNVAIFEGDVNPAPNINDMLHFYFVGGLDPSVTLEQGTTPDFTVDISNQSGKLPVLSYGSAVYSGNNSINCMLKNKCALVEFKFENGTNNKTTKISNMLCEAKIDFANGCITPTEKLDAIALYNDPNDNDKKVKWAILLFGGARKSMGMVYRETQLYKTQNIDLYDYYDGVNVPLLSENNNYLYGSSAISVNNIVDNKVNNKVFVVSANGNAVRFAHGNLKCTKTGDNWSDGYTWSFMTNQYDRLNASNVNVGTDYSNSTEIDLFGWGCTGFQDNASQTYFEPYHTTFDYNAYGPAGDFLSVIGKSDWGAFVHDDGYNWRTLTAEEMEYMTETRYNADGKRGAAQVIGVNGVVVLPEQWNGAAINSNFKDTWTDNTYDANSWPSMETNGALFLPITGYRTNASVSSVTSNGYYWTSSKNNNNQIANCLKTAKNSWDVTTLYKGQGAAVRLVR